ncbi:hypothetical protein BDY19DRAFT_954768 [Irpex rosettiformis]|uniref:Uncharacterized protein n=1 Tax=Irpex rosettiformis TaxID=378272 RepID=A0ACB8U0C3_9APHY|nr:hypothetical protein BDY19DRAFT_954768 [Irpex rosettiformis]
MTTNCTTYANLPPHHLVPERARAREGGTPDPSALSPSQRTRSGRAARNPAASSLKFAASAHDDASNVLRSASLSTPKTTLVGSLSGSPRKAPPSLPNLPNPNLLGCDTPAADSEPLSSIPTRLDHRQLQHVSNVTKSASNNLSADDGVCHSGHGHVSLPGAVVGVHHPNANVNFISRNASSIQERGKKIYRSGCDAREEERRPALSLTVPSPPPPLHPSVSVLEQAKHREEEDQCLLTAFLCSRSRVMDLPLEHTHFAHSPPPDALLSVIGCNAIQRHLHIKIIHPTFAQGLPNILQCVSRVTTAMRDVRAPSKFSFEFAAHRFSIFS